MAEELDLDLSAFHKMQIFPQYVTKGDMFVSIPSKRGDLETLKVNMAIERGAKIIIASDSLKYESIPPGVSFFRCEDPRHIVSLISSKLTQKQPDHITGITGTCGKTSVASFLCQSWKSRGYKAATMGSLGVIPPNEEKIILEEVSHKDGKTRISYEYLKVLSERGTTHLALEATSAALEQRRLDHVRFESAVFLNLSFEHLNYHRTMNEYFLAKSILFTDLLKQGSLAVINQDDFYGLKLIEMLSKKLNIITFGKEKGDIFLKNCFEDKDFNLIEIIAFGKSYKFRFPVPGYVQALNILPVIALNVYSGLSVEEVLDTTAHYKVVPGRMEHVATLANNARIYLDFAHKPDALEKTLKSITKIKKKHSRIFTVLGCDGNADHNKQPLMGEIAGNYSHKVYITDDNPRKSDALKIRQVIRGDRINCIEIPVREEAIFEAISELGPDDFLVIIPKLPVYNDKVAGMRPVFASEEKSLINKCLADIQGKPGFLPF